MKINKNYWDVFFRQKSDVIIRDYDGWLSSYQKLLIPESKTLDLGCGSGTNIAALLNYGLIITAADFSKNAIEFVETRFPEIETSCFDMTESFPFSDNTFDIMISDLSLHYFSWKDTNKIICEISRVLKKSGLLIARIHSTKEIEQGDLLQLEKNYYFTNNYSRRYFEIEDIEKLFIKWQIENIEEKEIIRYNTEKSVIEFLAINR